jgi:hypothetical protein
VLFCLSFNNKGGIELGVCPGHAPGYHASRPCMSWPIRVRLFHFANGTRERYGNRSRQFRSLEFLRRWCGGGCDGGCACSCGVRRPSGVGGSSAGSGFVMSVVADSAARACPLGHLVFFFAPFGLCSDEIFLSPDRSSLWRRWQSSLLDFLL